MTKARKEYKENQTSWKYFERRADESIRFKMNEEARLEFKVLLEILKELQYMNNK